MELSEVGVDQATWQKQLRPGHRARQQEINSLERSARRLRAVEIMAVPGLVQIASYARAIFETQSDLHNVTRDIDEAVQARLERQQVLHEPGHEFEILVAESALRYPVCSPSVMIGQIDHLSSVIGLPGVRFGLLPLERQLPFVLTHGFTMLDDLVLVETLTSELQILDPDQVRTYHRIVDALWVHAVEGDEARRLLAETAKRWL